MKIQEINAFLAVCKYGSFTRAAEKTFTTQPTISWQISSLEKELGHPLIVRGKGIHQITLTQAGTLFYPQAMKWSQLWAETEELLSMQSTDSYRFACVPSLSARLFSPIHSAFLHELPDCTLSLMSRTSMAAFELVERGNFDSAFVCAVQPSSTVNVVPFMKEKMMFVCRNDAPYGDSVKISELRASDYVYINWTEESAAWMKHWFGEQAKPFFIASDLRDAPAFFVKPEIWMTIPAAVMGDFPPERFRVCNLDVEPPRRYGYLISKYPQRAPYYPLLRRVLVQYFRAIPGAELLVTE